MDTQVLIFFTLQSWFSVEMYIPSIISEPALNMVGYVSPFVVFLYIYDELIAQGYRWSAKC